jgi:hypothetical protein
VPLEQAQATLVAIAPVVGTARATTAAGNILRAVLGAPAPAEVDREPVPLRRRPRRRDRRRACGPSRLTSTGGTAEFPGSEGWTHTR